MARYVMGVDGGGTGSRYELLDADTGLSAARGSFGAMSPFVPEALGDAARSIAEIMRAAQGECLMLRCGCAGAGEEAMAAAVVRALADAGITCPVSVAGDHVNALDTAFGDGDGALVIAGTGSVAIGREGKAFFRAGGRGHVFDDGGSAYAIGRDMLAAAARASDGRAGKTVLTDIVFDACGVGDIGALTSYYTSPGRAKGDIAALAARLDAALDAGDGAAESIAQGAARELALTAFAVCRRFKTPPRLAMTGSVLTKNARIRLMFTKRMDELLPGTAPFMLEKRAETGAAQRALSMAKMRRQ